MVICNYSYMSHALIIGYNAYLIMINKIREILTTVRCRARNKNEEWTGRKNLLEVLNIVNNYSIGFNSYNLSPFISVPDYSFYSIIFIYLTIFILISYIKILTSMIMSYIKL